MKWSMYAGFFPKEFPKLIIAKIKGYTVPFCALCMFVQKVVDNPIKTIIDVGAYKGEFSKASKYVFPNAKVISFEVNEEYKEIVGTSLFNFALWNKNDVGEFSIIYNEKNKPSSTSSFFVGKKGKEKAKLEDKRIEKKIVKRRRFDSLELKIDKPCFLKVDVEGSELEVLEGFGERLKEIEVIQLEYLVDSEKCGNFKSRNNFDKIVLLLNKFNFKRFIQPLPLWVDGKFIPTDIIFFKEKQ